MSHRTAAVSPWLLWPPKYWRFVLSRRHRTEFVTLPFVQNYVPFDHEFAFLYNSYCEAEGDRIARQLRGLLTRLSLNEIRAYRAHVDGATTRALDYLPEPGLELVGLGCHHEEQHQELLPTDVLHLFAQSLLLPAAGVPAETHTGAGTDQFRCAALAARAASGSRNSS
jgi:hypothetical protein